MKKIGLLAVIAMAMISCGNTYTAKQITLNDRTDSVNYALGLMNGSMIKMQQLAQDSSDAVINEFLGALEKAYNGKTEKLSEAQETARNIAFAVKDFETKGLAENKSFPINEKIFFQALVNGLYEDTTVMTQEVAAEYFRSIYMTSMGKDSVLAGKTLKAKCPSSAAPVALANQADSANYAFGFLNGSEVKMYVLASDSTGDDRKDFIKEMNKSLKLKCRNPQLMALGQNIGKLIREQEEEGLVGIPGMETRINVILQGFVNSMKGAEKDWEPAAAQAYVQRTMDEIKYGETRRLGEEFLAANALNDSVQVTESGLQYKVIKIGNGKKPSATDKVRVHYEGTLIDGTIFDSSYQRGEPTSFGVNQVIAGWTEGLQLMPVGSTFMFYIPYNLAYGERGAGQQISPYATLIFKVELLGIEK